MSANHMTVTELVDATRRILSLFTKFSDILNYAVAPDDIFALLGEVYKENTLLLFVLEKLRRVCTGISDPGDPDEAKVCMESIVQFLTISYTEDTVTDTGDEAIRVEGL